MSRTHRKHEPPGRHAKRGPKNKSDDLKPLLKSRKQARPNERNRLRKEYL